MENVKICVVLVASLNESFNVLQNGCEVEFLLLLFLALKGSFGCIYIFFSYYTLLFSLMTIPSANIFDSFDWGKLIVVNVDIMSNPHKWLMDISNGV